MKIFMLRAYGNERHTLKDKVLISDFAFKSKESAQDFLPEWEKNLIGEREEMAEFENNSLHSIKILIDEIQLRD